MKQLLATICAVMLAAALFAGCGESEPTATPPTAAAAEPATPVPTSETPAPEPTPTTGAEPSETSDASSAPEVPEVVEDRGVAPANIDVDRHPVVLDASLSPLGDGSYRFSVTLSSPYDTPQRYADAWRVLDADDNELGIRILLHDHATEQPFTRSETVIVPEGVEVVYIEGRDQANGWSGQRFAVAIASP
ncbi:MAG: hypothetical protein AAF567_10205 [Actinomycetota bacterium]